MEDERCGARGFVLWIGRRGGSLQLAAFKRTRSLMLKAQREGLIGERYLDQEKKKQKRKGCNATNG